MLGVSLRPRRRSEGEWIRADVPHLRIVSDAEWNAAHDRLGGVRRAYLKLNAGHAGGRPPSSIESRYLLSGLGCCSKCGASMTVRSGTHGNGQRFFYVCASYDRRGHAVCDNALRLPMMPADDEILSKLRDYVLDPPVVEIAIHNALAELQPSQEERDRRRTDLQTEIRKLDEEEERLVAAIAAAGQVDALARALQERERQKTRLVAELAALGKVSRQSSSQTGRLEHEMRERLTEWRALLHRRTPLARQVVSKLLDGRIAWTPFQTERRYEYQGRVKLDHLLAGSVFTESGIPVHRYDTYCKPNFSKKLAFETTLKLSA